MLLIRIILPVLLISYLVFRMFFGKYFIRNREIVEIKKKILHEVVPENVEEARMYEVIIEKFKNIRPLRAWGCFLLLKYYKDHYNDNNDLLELSLKFGEIVRSEYRDYSFYEDALFILGNAYFFEIFDFNKAVEIYTQLIEERSNTRWKSICMDRIELIAANKTNDEALRLYVSAEKYFEESKLEEAEFYLKEVINRHDKTDVAVAATYFLGDINYYKYNDLDKAIKYYKVTVAKFPDHQLAENSMYKVGEILRKLKQWEAAVEIYKNYIQKYKNSPFKDDAYYYIGESYQNLGRLREAKNSFNLILGDFPNSKWTDVIYHKVQDINKIIRGVEL